MTTHTGFYLRPTLAETVDGWLGYGFTKPEAIRELIASRMRSQNAKGRGNRARRRARRLKSK